MKTFEFLQTPLYLLVLAKGRVQSAFYYVVHLAWILFQPIAHKVGVILGNNTEHPTGAFLFVNVMWSAIEYDQPKCHRADSKKILFRSLLHQQQWISNIHMHKNLMTVQQH